MWQAGFFFFRLVLTDFIVAFLVMLVVKPLLYAMPACKALSFLPFRKKFVFDLPQEIMKLIYRQSLLWVGSMFMPLMFALGFVSQLCLYFVYYSSCVAAD